ncbi:dihydrolipoamide acetyltransferase family protein [Jatrophihabitans fulvus]
MPDFLLPDLGEGLDGAEIVSWHVAVGDTVQIDQPVVEVETAKASVEVPVPFAGTVTALHAEPGTRLAVGQPLLTVGEAQGLREPGVVSAGGSGNVLIGYGTPADEPRRRRRRALEAVPEPAPEPVAAGPVPVISPLVRKQARDAGLDLRALAATAPHGLVRRADVEAALARQERQPDPASRTPLRGVRGAMAEMVARSRREIPEATVWVDVDATELLAARDVLRARADGNRIGVLALLARFVVLGLRRFPELNSSVDGSDVVQHDAVHVGFAAQTERGLVVPVVRDASSMSLRALADALAERTAAARDGKLTPSDLTGGTITVNNYGVFGVDGSAAIINHPEAAMVGIGRIVDKPWVVDGQLAVRKVTQLTLAFDHRVCDGGVAGGFLRYLADCVESPLVALGDA